MKTRREIDPELHVLRSIGRKAEGRARQEIEGARFNLYAAFEAGDADAARRWVSALRVAILSALGDNEAVAAANVALSYIEASC